MEFLKVSSKSSPASVAGAIAGLVKDGSPVSLQCIGAGAVNQAIKAVAVARGFLIPVGLDISCSPTFSDIDMGGEKRTALRLAILVHPLCGMAAQAQSSQVVSISREVSNTQSGLTDLVDHMDMDTATLCEGSAL